MWQRFTERARRIVFFAQEEAGQLGENYVSTEHLLLGLLHEKDTVAARLLALLDVPLEKVHSELMRQVARGDGRLGQDMQLTAHAKRVVDLAYDEAKTLNNNYIGSEHLLLGLVRTTEGLASRVLNDLGVSLERTREELRKLQAEYAEKNVPLSEMGGLEDTQVQAAASSNEQPISNPVRKEGGAMWQRFTERARRVVFSAQEEAGQLGENYVSTEHLLLGLVRESDSVAARILDRTGVSLGRIRSEVERQVARGDGRPGSSMQLTPRAKRVIDLAYDEARQFGHNYIGTEHLLLGLIREGEGLAGRVLAKLDVDLEKIRTQVRLVQDEKPPIDTGRKATSEPSTSLPIPSFAEMGERLNALAQIYLNEHMTKPPLERRFIILLNAMERIVTGESAQETPRFYNNRNDPKVGDLGVAKGEARRSVVEVATDARAFVALTAIFQAKDALGYEAMAHGDQTMFLLPTGTPIKLLVPPPGSGDAKDAGGYFVRVLSGDYMGYAGWIAPTSFEQTGPDDAPFPPNNEGAI